MCRKENNKRYLGKEPNEWFETGGEELESRVSWLSDFCLKNWWIVSSKMTSVKWERKDG